MGTKQDLNGVRNAQDLERKYDFAALLGLKKNVEIQLKSLIKVENELNDFINSTLGNIDNLQEQIDGKITTWYYEGEPTLNNKPAVDWNTDALKSEHEGDLYYDKLTGYSYRFQLENNSYYWQKITDKDVVESLAIANSAKDTADSKRQVFIQEPTTPYDTGDLWISNNEIFICQVSRKTGSFNQNDWINNLKYTDDTVAESVGESLTVLEGTVQTITKNYVKYTDLSTGGSTTIAGENITTGVIKSQNYASGVKGMKIDLSNGTIDTKNTKWDEYGNIKLSNGAEIIGDKGLLTNLQFIGKGTLLGSHEFADLGLELDLQNNEFVKIGIELFADIPSNITIKEAYITLIHQPIYWQYETETATNKLFGWSRSIGLFKSNLQSYHMAEYGSGYYNTEETKTEISNAFGSSGWTPSTPSTSSSKVETKKSIDIKSNLVVGQLNKFVIESKNSLPSWNTDYFQNVKTLCQNTGRVMAILNVIGYMK